MPHIRSNVSRYVLSRRYGFPTGKPASPHAPFSPFAYTGKVSSANIPAGPRINPRPKIPKPSLSMADTILASREPPRTIHLKWSTLANREEDPSLDSPVEFAEAGQRTQSPKLFWYRVTDSLGYRLSFPVSQRVSNGKFSFGEGDRGV